MDNSSSNQAQNVLQGGGSVHSNQPDEPRVEDLPLDKKLEVLRKYNPCDFFEEGRYIDCQDTVNAWCLAKIMQVDNRNMNIHYDGWSNRWDVEKQRVEKLIETELSGLGAFQTTQYFRGSLYVYVDFLLGSNIYTDEQIDAVNDFLYSVLRLLHTWMKKFGQLKVNSDLYLIDENIALLSCWPEFVDLLKKMFGCCHRCIRFYALHDKNQVKYEQSITIDQTNVDFQDKRKLNEDEFDIIEFQEIIKEKKLQPFGQLLNFLNFFAMIGGFDTILEVLKFGNEAEEKIPFEIYDALTSPFRNCQQFLSKSFALNFVNHVKDLIFSRINGLSDKELKELDKESIGRLLLDIKDFLLLAMTEQETAQLIETTQLQISLKFLKCTYLEKRLKGINDIKNIIDRVEANQSLKQRNLRMGENYDKNQLIYINKIKPSKFLTVDYMKQWILENKILEIVFGENTHLEIVKRGGCLLKFLAKQGSLAKDSVDLIWKCQHGKHEEMVRVVFGLIKDLVTHLPIDFIDAFYSKIQTVPQQQFDEKFLLFLKEFTLRALENFYEAKSKEVEMSEEATTDYDEICSKMEGEIVSNLRQSLQNMSHNILGDAKLYGLPIFWELIQDKMTSQVQYEMMEISLNSLTEILKSPQARNVRIYYLLKSLEGLLKQESVIQSVIIAMHIIGEFSDIEYRDNYICQQKLIQMINGQINLVDQVIKNIEIYYNTVKEKAKALNEKQKLSDDIAKQIFIGRQNHESSIQKYLDFLEFLILGAQNDQVFMGTKNIDTLWRIFVQQPNFNQDQTLFLKWINKDREGGYQKEELFLFTDEEKKHFFANILCNPTYVNFKKISLAQVKCFHKYFKVINKQEHFIETYARKRVIVRQYDKLIGLQTLERITIESENEKVREESIELLVDLHLKFDFNQMSIQEQCAIWNQFIEFCYKNMENEDLNVVTNTIQLLSTFLDRYEGKKPLKPDFRYPTHFSSIQNNNITVHNKIHQHRGSVSVSYFQTIGHLRQKIADYYDMQINEFDMFIKQSYVDPDDNDDKYLKDVHQFSQVVIQKNQQYFPDQHPKFLISKNQQFFEKLFKILTFDRASLIEPTWELLHKLPVNEKLQKEIRELRIIEENKPQWNKILDPKSTYRLLYSLLIIKQNYMDQNNVDPQCAQWKKQFSDLGGFSHLLATFINLDVIKIESLLTLKCLECICSTIIDFMEFDKKCKDELSPHAQNIFLKCFHWIELISDYSLEIEKKRGQSIEEIQAKIQSNKLKRIKYKSYQFGNKQEKQGNDEEDDDSQESVLQSQIVKSNREVSSVVRSLLSFVHVLTQNIDPNIVILITKYENLESFLGKAMIFCEIPDLREEVSKRIRDMILSKSQTPEIKQMEQLISILIFKLLFLTPKHDYRTIQYYSNMSSMIQQLSLSDIQQLQEPAQKIMQNLIKDIIGREQKEKNAQEVDFILNGKINMLRVLLQKFSHLKQQVGEQILQYLLHDCLFKIPQGHVNKTQSLGLTPKCKSYICRQSTVQLICVIVRDCLPHLSHVLEYIYKFNQNQSWRTNKDHDWSISLMESEKSQSGYVGIKNLGCICYMNSLFQQVFMIPSMRKDILTVKRPELTQEEKDEDMLYQLQLLFAGLLKSEKQYVNPKSFCHAFKDWEGQPTNVLEQMDVEEFFNMFMDRLETSIKGSPQEKSIQYHFGGKFASEMICKGCPHFYERQEPFISLSITVKNKKSIIEGLNTFISGDMLEGDNAYLCEKCDKKVDTLKRTCIKKLPRYLIVALKRFEFDFDRMIRVKVNDYCEFPMELDMSDFTQEGLRRKEKEKAFKEEKGEDAVFNEPLKYPKEYYEYKLSGVVVHTGTADSGHYYSFISDREHPESGKWYEFNDHIVRDFDPADIPSECFGGEESFQGYNMVQMKSMKWRNAYILLYERKNPIEVPSDDEEEKQSTKVQTESDVDMNSSQIQILPEIEEKIAYENQKYWQNRFLFSQEYSEMVCEIALNWNTNCIVPKQYLSKNDDFHIYNTPRPQEYFQDQSIIDPADEKIDLKKIYSQKDLDLAELSVFKFVSQFYLTILQRAQNKAYIPSMLNIQKAYLNKNIECCKWLLQEFCNYEIIEETLLQCQSKEMRKFVVGLLYCAMLKLYPVERAQINQYWTQEGEEQKPTTILANFMLVLIKHLFDSRRFAKNVSQYLQLFARFASLGPETREFMIRGRMVGRLLEFFYEKISPFKDFFRPLEDIHPVYNEKPDIGIPTKIDKKQMSAYQELIENRRRKAMADGPIKYKYLIEAIGVLCRQLSIGPNPSPYQFQGNAYPNIHTNEHTLLLPEPKYIKMFLNEARRVRAYSSIGKAYCHLVFGDNDLFEKVKTALLLGLHDNDYDEVRPFLSILQMLMQMKTQANYEQRLDQLLSNFLDQVRNNCNYYRFMEVMFEFIFKITSRNQDVRNWFQNRRNHWEWLWDWANSNKNPPNPIAQNSSVKFFKKKASMPQLQTHSSLYKMDSTKGQLMASYRLRRLQFLIDQNVPDLSHEPDLDFIDMQDHKFVKGEYVDQYQRKFEKSISYQVETVLDEMIFIKPAMMSSQGDSYQNNGFWCGCDTDKLIPSRSHKQLYKTKLIETIQSQFDQRKREIDMNRGQVQGDKEPQEPLDDDRMEDNDDDDEEEDSHYNGNQ